MKTLHRALMAVAMTAVLAFALGTHAPWESFAEAQHGPQHGHGSTSESHADAVAEHLELTDEQREALTKPIEATFTALREIVELHEQIAAELTDAQKAKFTNIVHESLRASLMPGEHSGHGGGRH